MYSLPLLVTIPKVASFIYYIAFMMLTGIAIMIVNIPMQVHMQNDRSELLRACVWST